VDSIGPRAIGRGHFAFAHQIDNLLAIRFGQLEAAAELASGFACLGQSGFGAFADEAAFEFRHRSDHVHDHDAGGGGIIVLTVLPLMLTLSVTQ